MPETEIEKRTYFHKSVTKEQCKDTGLAMILILLLIGYFTANLLYLTLAIPVLVLVMVTPGWFYPIAILWYSFSTILGTVMSRIILTTIYFLMVLPVAGIRKIAGIDNLRLNQFKKGKESVMIVREHEFISNDVQKPY